MPPLLLFGIGPLAEVMLGIVLAALVVAFGTYVGVLVALQSFFGASTWSDVSQSETD